jgi:hypothetical protein
MRKTAQEDGARGRTWAWSFMLHSPHGDVHSLQNRALLGSMNAKEDILNNGGLTGLRDYTVFRRRVPKSARQTEKKRKLLNRWYIKIIPNFTTKIELKYWVCVCGYVGDDTLIQSSAVIDAESPRAVVTENTVYILGQACDLLNNRPHPDFDDGVIERFLGGFPRDWRKIIQREVLRIMELESGRATAPQRTKEEAVSRNCSSIEIEAKGGEVAAERKDIKSFLRMRKSEQASAARQEENGVGLSRNVLEATHVREGAGYQPPAARQPWQTPSYRGSGIESKREQTPDCLEMDDGRPAEEKMTPETSKRTLDSGRSAANECLLNEKIRMSLRCQGEQKTLLQEFDEMVATNFAAGKAARKGRLRMGTVKDYLGRTSFSKVCGGAATCESGEKLRETGLSNTKSAETSQALHSSSILSQDFGTGLDASQRASSRKTSFLSDKPKPRRSTIEEHPSPEIDKDIRPALGQSSDEEDSSLSSRCISGVKQGIGGEVSSPGNKSVADHARTSRKEALFATMGKVESNIIADFMSLYKADEKEESLRSRKMAQLFLDGIEGGANLGRACEGPSGTVMHDETGNGECRPLEEHKDDAVEAACLFMDGMNNADGTRARGSPAADPMMEDKTATRDASNENSPGQELLQSADEALFLGSIYQKISDAIASDVESVDASDGTKSMPGTRRMSLTPRSAKRRRGS